MNTRSDVILERMMALHPKVIDLTLDRVWRLLDRLGNPQDQLPPVIHIAGTNGKGSTLAMLRAGLEAAGKRVHAYTSPHLVRFHERIRLAGALISEEALADLLDECEAANSGEPITYFEITTCAALLAFARTPADYVLLEVGLGGRLDATNVITKPALTIVTPVSMDHEAFLGDRIEDIAAEKAGIIKSQVPLIVGRQNDAALEVIERKASGLRAPLCVLGQHWHVAPERDGMVFQDESGLVQLPRPVLLGTHQIENAGAAIAALRHLGFGTEVCEAAVTNATWAARMQRLRHGPLIDQAPNTELWLDGGHNPAAGRAMAQTLSGLPNRSTYLICGMLNTKAAVEYLRPLADVVDGMVAITIPNEENALPASALAKAGQEAGLSASEADTTDAALEMIARQTPDARVVICGSLYLAGNILREHS